VFGASVIFGHSKFNQNFRIKFIRQKILMAFIHYFYRAIFKIPDAILPEIFISLTNDKQSAISII
jgi:hypothetical protein